MDPEAVSRLLLHGALESRRRLAADLVRAEDPRLWQLLADTVASPGPWKLRARCLEALGMAAGTAEQAVAERILNTFRSSAPIKLEMSPAALEQAADQPHV